MIRILVLAAALLLAGAREVSAQQPTAASDSLNRALTRISVRLDSLEAGLCPGSPLPLPVFTPGNATTDSLAAAVARINQRLERLRAARCTANAPQATDTTSDDLAALREAANQAAGPGGAAAQADTTPTGPTQFVGKQRNASALNPEISATGDVRLVARDQRIQRDNGVAQEFEVALQSTLDPYSNTKIILTFGHDGVGVEEGYLYWTGLPGRIRADLGLFREQLGDLNRWHLHALPETEYPLVYQKYLGEGGLSGAGLSLYTALPVSLVHGTHEIWLQGTTAESDPLTAGSRQITGLGRLQNFWQLTRSTYAQFGFTGVHGENHDSLLTTRLLGFDFRLTWRPPSAGTRQDLTIRAEGYQLHSKQAGIVEERYGGFADVQYKAGRRWVLGARYDRVEEARGPRTTEWRLTPAITWWESEFVFLRLQGQHRRVVAGGKSDDATLQVVWAMGPHKHETY